MKFVQVQCPACSTMLEVAASSGPSQFNCPTCGQLMQLDGARPSSAKKEPKRPKSAEKRPPSRSDVDESYPTMPKRPRRESNNNNSNVVPLIIAGTIAICALLIIVVAFSGNIADSVRSASLGNKRAVAASFVGAQWDMQASLRWSELQKSPLAADFNGRATTLAGAGILPNEIDEVLVVQTGATVLTFLSLNRSVADADMNERMPVFEKYQGMAMRRFGNAVVAAPTPRLLAIANSTSEMRAAIDNSRKGRELSLTVPGGMLAAVQFNLGAANISMNLPPWGRGFHTFGVNLESVNDSSAEVEAYGVASDTGGVQKALATLENLKANLPATLQVGDAAGKAIIASPFTTLGNRVSLRATIDLASARSAFAAGVAGAPVKQAASTPQAAPSGGNPSVTPTAPPPSKPPATVAQPDLQPRQDVAGAYGNIDLPHALDILCENTFESAAGTRFGKKRCVLVLIRGVADQETVRKLEAAFKRIGDEMAETESDRAFSAYHSDLNYLVTMGPIDDVAAFSKKITFAKIVGIDPVKRRIIAEAPNQ